MGTVSSFQPQRDSAALISELQAGISIERNSQRLFERYYRPVYGFFRRRGFSAPDSDDLAQDTLFKALHEISSVRREAGFEAWLFTIAANIYRNELRRRGTDKRAGHEVPLETEGRNDPGVSRAASPERVAVERQGRYALAQAVEELPRQRRKCLVLRVQHDLKYREIATLMNISIETVKAHLFQARQRLKAELADYFDDSDF